jgi:hypothetical protein
MKRLSKLLFLFTLLGIIAGGCELFQGVKWDEGYNYTFTINPAEAGTHSFSEENIPTDIDQILSDNGITEKRLESVKIKEIKATIQPNSHESTFDIMDSGTLYMQGKGLTQVAVATWPNPVPAGASSVVLKHNENELRDHLLSGELTFTGNALLNAAHGGTTYVRVDVTFELNGKVLF